MAESKINNSKRYRLRSRIPVYFRIGAVAAIIIAIVVVVIGLYRERSRAAFVLKSEHTKLSTDVVSEINGYERLETDDGVTKYYIKADHAKTFSDEHLELQNVYLEVYDAKGLLSDKMTAESALYVPEPEKNFTTYLKGNVVIDTSDALKIRADDLSYSRRTEIADVEAKMEFERDNVRGKAFGATANLGGKKLELLRDVKIETFESEELLRSNVRYAKITAGNAAFDQVANRIDLGSTVSINVLGTDRTSDINAGRAVLELSGADARSKDVRQFELFDSVRIVSKAAAGSPTTIDAGYALFEKATEKYVLKNGTHILTSANGKDTDIEASEAIYEFKNGKLALTGNVEIAQGTDLLKGDTAHANLFPDQKVKDSVIRGNAFVRQAGPDRSITVSAPELNAAWIASGSLSDVNAVGQTSLEFAPNDAANVSKVLASAVRGIGLVFKGEGLLERLKTDGRTTIDLRAKTDEPYAANKKVSADNVTTLFQANGKDIRRAEAVGNAELLVEPLHADRKNYQTNIRAPRLECNFLATGNQAEVCTAGKKVKAERKPTVQVAGKGTQTISSDSLVARFDGRSGDISALEASGSAKFTELDRNALANEMTFTQSDEIIRLRGGEPTVWDGRGRAKAGEVDLDTRNDRSALRKGVSTTYYNQKSINGATPFSNSEKAVYLTADSAEFDHAADTAVYTGNARGWQENNYVRGNRLTIDQARGTFLAEGKIQSMIHNAKIKQKGRESTVPTSASAGSMAYDKTTRRLQYRESVDIRQGTDRITAGSADIFLDSNNEIIRTVASSNVSITQPGKRASGDWAEYSPADEIATLRGNPATVVDQVNGSSQSGQITMSLRDNRVVSSAKTNENPTGRIRSVYKIKDLKP